MNTMILFSRTGSEYMNNIIKNKQQFEQQAIKFLRTIHGSALKLDNNNKIQIGSFKPSTVNDNVNTIEEAVNMTFELCNQGRDVYYGVNAYTAEVAEKKTSHM